MAQFSENQFPFEGMDMALSSHSTWGQLLNYVKPENLNAVSALSPEKREISVRSFYRALIQYFPCEVFQPSFPSKMLHNDFKNYQTRRDEMKINEVTDLMAKLVLHLSKERQIDVWEKIFKPDEVSHKFFTTIVLKKVFKAHQKAVASARNTSLRYQLKLVAMEKKRKATALTERDEKKASQIETDYKTATQQTAKTMMGISGLSWRLYAMRTATPKAP